MTHLQMWQAFGAAGGNTAAAYEAWCFGDDADTLAQLVLQGEKTATASAFDLYALENEPLPQAGQFSVILDSREEAVCIIRTDRVYVASFDRVTAEHAFREGEGDKSLAYWRQVHERFFRQELSQAGLTFSPDMPVVCEEFTKVFPK